MRQVNQVALASLNSHKLTEFQDLFKTLANFQIVSLDELVRNASNLSRVEKHLSYAENAAEKARLANRGSHYPSLGDDSGLEVDCLNGAPGVRSHRYAIPKAGVGQDQANRDKLLQEIKDKFVNQQPQVISARLICSLALVVEGILLTGTGVLEGQITLHPKGSNGFGYDSLFIPKGFSKTLAEMSSGEKNGISHRAKAAQDLMAKAKALGIVIAKP